MPGCLGTDSYPQKGYIGVYRDYVGIHRGCKRDRDIQGLGFGVQDSWG